DSMIVAFNKDNGKEAWKALDTPAFPDGPGYGPPTLIEAAGVTQLVLYHSRGVTSFDPLTGKEYWSIPLPSYNGMTIMAPRKDGDLLYVGGVFDNAAVLKLAKDKPGASVVWKEGKGERTTKLPERGLFPVNMTPWAEGGILYGVDQPGTFRAVKIETGERL